MKLLLSLILFFTSCSQHAYIPTVKEQLANKVLKNAAVEIQKKTELRLSGDGARMLDEIKMLALAFDSYGELSIEQGRELLIIAAEEILKAVNENKEIQQYLFNRPFMSNNVEVRIFIRKSDGHNVPLGELSVISLIRNVLEYDIRDPLSERLTTIHKESLDEALSKIAQQEPVISKDEAA